VQFYCTKNLQLCRLIKHFLMKKYFLPVLMCLCLWINGGAQTTTLTYPTTINVACSDYQNNLNRSWNINIATAKSLKLSYTVNTEANCDQVYIYAVINNQDSLLGVISGQNQSGCFFSPWQNGKMKVVFLTDGTNNCASNSSYSGFRVEIAESDTAMLILNNSEQGVRLQNSHAYVDVGADNHAAQFSTNAERFVFNKAVHLQDGKISNYGLFPLSLQTNGLSRITILNSGWVGIGTTTPTATLDVYGNIKANELIINGISWNTTYQTLLQQIDQLTQLVTQQQAEIERLHRLVKQNTSK